MSLRGQSSESTAPRAFLLEGRKAVRHCSEQRLVVDQQPPPFGLARNLEQVPQGRGTGRHGHLGRGRQGGRTGAILTGREFQCTRRRAQTPGSVRGSAVQTPGPPLLPALQQLPGANVVLGSTNSIHALRHQNSSPPPLPKLNSNLI